MTSYRSLNHTKWACQYHVVFIPKYRKKAIYADLRRYLGDVLRRLAQRRESEVEEGHLMVDHVHLMLCQGRSKIRPPWRRKTRPSGRGVAWLKAAVRRRGQDAGAAAGGRAFLLCSRR